MTPVSSQQPVLVVMGSPVEGLGLFSKRRIPKGGDVLLSHPQIVSRNCSATASVPGQVTVIGAGIVDINVLTHSDY